jgi:hypothetical protein
VLAVNAHMKRLKVPIAQNDTSACSVTRMTD